MLKREELENSYNKEIERVAEEYKKVYEELVDKYLFYNNKKKVKSFDLPLCPIMKTVSSRVNYFYEGKQDLLELEDKLYELGMSLNDIRLWKKLSLDVIKSYPMEYYIRGVRLEGSDTELKSVTVYFDDPNDGYGHTFHIYESAKVWIPSEDDTKEKTDKKPWYKRIFKL